MNLNPLKHAIRVFIREEPLKTTGSPHVRDGVDLKRWMMLVVYSLVPCALMAIWNSGVQSLVYGSANPTLYTNYLQASHSISTYFSFCFKHISSIIFLGAKAFLPLLLISYLVGGFWEGLFACIRGHDISEGFLVTGMLFALVLPTTIPYWMAAFGISVGIVLGKELFGGTGMNILNPALTARCLLFFTFPEKMTGEIWAGTNPTQIQTSVQQLDGVTTQTPLNLFNISMDIKKIHVDTIAMHMGKIVPTSESIEKLFAKWSNQVSTIKLASVEQLKAFLTTPITDGGLGLSPENFLNALNFAKLKYGVGILTNGNFFMGNMLGSVGETSTLACLLGAILLLTLGLAAWRIIVAMLLSAFVLALFFQLGSDIGPLSGAWNPAKFAFPAYKHLLLGGFAFGLIFMATEPVTAPKRNLAKWWYGILIGVTVIIIRLINPAFPEGVMLAILFGNVFASLFDTYALKSMRKKRVSYAQRLR